MRPLIPLVAVVLLLAGCAAQAPTAAPIDPASPEPTPVAQVYPSSRVPGVCGQLISELTLQPVVGKDSMVTSSADEFSIPAWVEGQLGGTTCYWAKDDATLMVQILPDASAQFSYAADDPSALANDTIGDKSDLSCYGGDGEFLECYFDFTTGGYWIDGTFSGQPAVSSKAFSVSLIAALNEAAATLGLLGDPLPVWTPPAGYVGAPGCATLPIDNFATAALGSRDFDKQDQLSLPQSTGITDYELATTNYSSCMLTSADGTVGTSLTVLAGGAWVLTTVSADAKPLQIAGADAAFELNDLVIAAVGDSLVAVDTSDAVTTADAVAGIEAIASLLPVEAN